MFQQQRLFTSGDGGYFRLAAGRTARLTTAPVRLHAETIRLNIEFAGDGRVRAGLLGGDGSVLPGFGLDDCLPLTDSGLACELRWNGKSPGLIAGEDLRVAIELDNAKLYAIAGLSQGV